ncbi:MAG TPA: GNAT family N-acetyltransferase, partial [Thermoanaerobaculia bacterium]|nr:GNAT family N-acetyltransferase [Thermoanaerobaculia bacterium]
MRGQKLYIRPIEPADHEAVARFLLAQGRPADAPPLGLLGKLVGELVAVVRMEIAGDALRIADVVVAAELRRKRIGRLMIDEAARIAVKMDRKQLVAEPPPESRGFFERLGFRGEG